VTINKILAGFVPAAPITF